MDHASKPLRTHRSPDQRPTVSSVIEDVGTGRFHVWAGIILGIANASDAVHLLAIGYIIVQFDHLSSAAKGALSAAVFAGMLVGGSFAGRLGDRYGRKITLLCFLAFASLSAGISATMPSWPYLAAARCSAGIGVGGTIPAVFTLYPEFLPVKNRGFYINIVAWFWAVGSIFTAAVAWIMIGHYKISWRYFLLVCEIPSLTALLLVFLYVPESPTWCDTVGDMERCKSILNTIAKRCDKTTGLEDPKAQLDRESTSEKTSTAPVSTLFRPLLLRRSVALSVVWFTLSFGWYGLILWIPTLFKKAHFHIDPYQNAFLVSAANIPGNIVAAFLIDRVGRKRLLVASLFLGCLCAAGFSVSHNATLTVALSCALNAVSIVGWNSLDCISSECFPTSVRSTGVGFLTSFGRAGSIAGQFTFGFLVNKSVTGLLLTAAGFLLIGAGAASLLPETSGVDLPRSYSMLEEDLETELLDPKRQDSGSLQHHSATSA